MKGLVLTAAGIWAAMMAASAVAAPLAVGGTAQGEYIESRSASVYAGPCHYSNEAVTAGRSATLAWHFESGEWNGTPLRGLNAVAVMDADANLGGAGVPRRTVLYFDSSATALQASALRDLFQEKYASALGRVVSVKMAPIQVSVDGLDYRVKVAGIADLDVNRYPCQHCTEDYHIWYEPFVPAKDVIVGKTTHTAYHDNVFTTSWDDSQEANSAFVGTFSL